jgi:type III secretory pathway component EscR
MFDVHPHWVILAGGTMALLPLLMALTTSYVKVSIVLHLLKNALGLQHAPGPIGEAAISLALSLAIMAPVLTEVGRNLESVTFPNSKQPPTQEILHKLQPAFQPWREFLLAHTGDRELSAVQNAYGQSTQEIPGKEIGTLTLLPAFLLSELKAAFSLGLRILLPFLLVDLIIGNLLAGLGLYMMSPQVIALPAKLLLFLCCDGWLLFSESLLKSYRG